MADTLLSVGAALPGRPGAGKSPATPPPPPGPHPLPPPTAKRFVTGPPRSPHGVLRRQEGRAPPDPPHLPPVTLDRLAAGVAQADEGLGLLLHEPFFDLDQPGLLQL